MNSFGHYPGVPWRKPEEVGYYAQLHSVSRAPGEFNELDYLSPVLTSGMATRSHYAEGFCEDASQVWTFYHSCSTIRPAATALLGNPI